MTAPRDPHADGPTPGPFSALLGFRYVSVGGRIGSTEAELTQGGVVVARAVGTHAVLAPPS